MLSLPTYSKAEMDSGMLLALGSVAISGREYL